MHCAILWTIILYILLTRTRATPSWNTSKASHAIDSSTERLSISRRLFRANHLNPESVIRNQTKERAASHRSTLLASHRENSANFSIVGSWEVGGEQRHSEFQVTVQNPDALNGCVDAAKQAFQVVADAWHSDMPVKVLIRFEDSDPGLIMRGEPTIYHVAGDILFTPAIFDFLAQTDNDPDLYDMDIVVNPNASWYVLGDRPSSEAYDFQSHMIREAQHGLYLTSSYVVDERGGYLLDGYETVFDTYVAVNPVDIDTTRFVCGVRGFVNSEDPAQGSIDLEIALTSNKLFFAGFAFPSIFYFPLYSPSKFVMGSSVVDWDPTNSEDYDLCDRLMSFRIERGQALRCIGRVTQLIAEVCLMTALESSLVFPLSPCHTLCQQGIGACTPLPSSMPDCLPADGVVKESNGNDIFVEDLRAGDLVFDGQETTEVVLVVDLQKGTNTMMYIQNKPIATQSHAAPSGLSASDYIVASHEAIFLVFTKSRYIQVNGVRISNYVSTYPIAIQELGIWLVEKSSLVRFLVTKYRPMWWYRFALVRLGSMISWLL